MLLQKIKSHGRQRPFSESRWTWYLWHHLVIRGVHPKKLKWMDSKHDGLEIVYISFLHMAHFQYLCFDCRSILKILRWEVKKDLPWVGLCTPFCNTKWVAATNWVCTPQLLVSTKWLHTPRVVLMLHALLECACDPFCRKGILTFKMIGKNSNPFCGKGLWNQHSIF